MSPAPTSIKFSVKLLADDHCFLCALSSTRRLKGLGDSVRALVGAARTLFWLPRYQAERLRLDMDARGQDVLTYVQELLARHYEALAVEDEAQRLSAQQGAGSGP